MRKLISSVTLAMLAPVCAFATVQPLGWVWGQYISVSEVDEAEKAIVDVNAPAFAVGPFLLSGCVDLDDYVVFGCGADR